MAENLFFLILIIGGLSLFFTVSIFIFEVLPNKRKKYFNQKYRNLMGDWK